VQLHAEAQYEVAVLKEEKVALRDALLQSKGHTATDSVPNAEEHVDGPPPLPLSAPSSLSSLLSSLTVAVQRSSWMRWTWRIWYLKRRRCGALVSCRVVCGVA